MAQWLPPQNMSELFPETHFHLQQQSVQETDDFKIGQFYSQNQQKVFFFDYKSSKIEDETTINYGFKTCPIQRKDLVRFENDLYVDRF